MQCATFEQNKSVQGTFDSKAVDTCEEGAASTISLTLWQPMNSGLTSCVTLPGLMDTVARGAAGYGERSMKRSACEKNATEEKWVDQSLAPLGQHGYNMHGHHVLSHQSFNKRDEEVERKTLSALQEREGRKKRVCEWMSG